MGLLWLIIFPGLLWGVPGYLASRWCLPRATPLERVATSALFGSSLVVPLAYVVPYVTRQPLTPIWVIGAAALVAAVFGVLLRVRPRDPSAVAASPGHAESQDVRVVLGVTALVVVVAFTSIPRSFEAVEVFSPCPHQASMFLLEDGSGSGLETWDPLWQTRVAHATEHPSEPGFGLGKILTIQRIGSAATLVQHFAFHGSGGLVVASFTYFGIGALFSALLLAQWLRSRALVVVLTAVTLIAYRLGGAYMVNENLLAASLITGVLWLVLRHRLGGPEHPAPDGPLLVLAGIVYAHAVGTRPELGLVLPALLLMARPWRPARFVIVGAVAALFLSPWLLTTYESFGQALYHPSLSRGAVPVSIFGFEVKFHPMNWPWNDALVRPETDPFPNLIMLPLENIAHFGVIFMAFVVLGVHRVGARLTGLLTLYAFPVYAVLLVIVNLDYDKLSYCVMSFGPLPYFAGAGLSSLLERPLARRRLVAFGVALAALVLLPQLLRNVELPVDPRRQFNESRDPRHFRPVEEKRASLLSPTFVPMFDWPDAMAGLDWSLSLFWHGRPVHRGPGDPAPGRLHFWCEQIPMVRSDRVALLDAPSLPPYASDPNDFELTKDYVPFSIALETSADVATVTMSRTSEIEVAITTEAGGGAPRTRYLTLGLLGDGQQPIDAIRVLVDGRPIPLDLLVVERHDRPTKPVLVSNHPWSYELIEDPESRSEDGRRLVLVPKPWPAVTCPGPGGDAAGIVFGPDGILDQREAHWRPAMVVRRVKDFPPRDESPCDALRLDRGGPGGPHDRGPGGPDDRGPGGPDGHHGPDGRGPGH